MHNNIRKIAIISFTSNGLKIAESIANGLKKEPDKYNFYGEIVLLNKNTVHGKIKSKMKTIFSEYDHILFVSSTGIAVRFISPYIKSKLEDPGVVVIDDVGNYAISLISGHIGGANEFTRAVAEIIGAKPVITTASDNRNIDAVDTFAIRHNLIIDSMESAKTITHMMVENKPIKLIVNNTKKHTGKEEIEHNSDYINNGVYNEIYQINYPNIVKDERMTVKDERFNVKREKDELAHIERFSGIIIISNRIYSESELNELSCGKPYVLLRPKNLFLGIGCRRGTEYEKIKQFIFEVFEQRAYSIDSIKKFGSIDLKKDETGLIELSNKMSWPFEVFNKDELIEFEHIFKSSDFVKKTVGVGAVSETVAYKFSPNIVIDKITKDGMTLTVSEEL